MAKKSNKGAADDIAMMSTAMTGSDLDSWLTQQGIGAAETEIPPVAAAPEPIKETEKSQKAEAEPVEPQAKPASVEAKVAQKADIAPQHEENAAQVTATGKTGKQRDRYEQQFFRRIEGFKKPTNMMYMSEKTYRLLAFLLRSSKESNTKITMPEIMENIIAQHIKDNEPVLNQMQQEHLERISKGF